MPRFPKSLVFASFPLMLILASWIAMTRYQFRADSPATWALGLLVAGPLLLFGSALFELALERLGSWMLVVVSLGRARQADEHEEQSQPFTPGWRRNSDQRLIYTEGCAEAAGVIVLAVLFLLLVLLRN